MKSFTIIMCRLISVWFIMTTIASGLGLLWGEHALQGEALIIPSFAMHGLVGFVLWFLSPMIAKIIINSTESKDDLTFAVTPEALSRIALVVVGVYAIVLRFPTLTNWLADPYPNFQPSLVIEAAVTVVMASLLIVFARKLSRFMA